MENKQKKEFINIINIKIQKDIFKGIMSIITIVYLSSTIIILPIAYFITNNLWLIKASSIVSICSSFILITLAKKILESFAKN